jgi:pimeloyl-ACP methyl ester carboxylesterase
MDMRGYGESDKPRRVSDYYIERLTGDVAQLIEALGYQRCVLVAHDWGGAVAWFFAHQYPDMVGRLVVCNCPHPSGMEDHLYTSRSQLLKSW